MGLMKLVFFVTLVTGVVSLVQSESSSKGYSIDKYNTILRTLRIDYILILTHHTNSHSLQTSTKASVEKDPSNENHLTTNKYSSPEPTSSTTKQDLDDKDSSDSSTANDKDSHTTTSADENSSPAEKYSSTSNTEKEVSTSTTIDKDSTTTASKTEATTLALENECQNNEEFSKCIHSICRAQFCSQRGMSPLCRKTPTSCKEGCICKENFLRNSDGICIPAKECNTTCGADETLDRCPRDCTTHYCPTRERDATYLECGRYTPGKCPRPVCKCIVGYKRADNGSCIPKEDCPAFSCKENEEYKACQQRCTSDNCNPGPISGCELISMMMQSRIPCYPRCMCVEGYKRTNGTCVPTEQCPKRKRRF